MVTPCPFQLRVLCLVLLGGFLTDVLWPARMVAGVSGGVGSRSKILEIGLMPSLCSSFSLLNALCSLLSCWTHLRLVRLPIALCLHCCAWRIAGRLLQERIVCSHGTNAISVPDHRLQTCYVGSECGVKCSFARPIGVGTGNPRHGFGGGTCLG